MFVINETTKNLADWIQDEIELKEEVSAGMRGMAVRRVQEWLCLHGFSLVIDEDYGPITTEVVADYQEAHSLEVTGICDQQTFESLTMPMRNVLTQQLDMSESIEKAVISYANAHLEQSPCEVGGQNRGPWVRLYMQGNDGKQWPWCAGFVTFILKQAVESLNVELPVPGSFSCDSLVAQARKQQLFLSEADAWNSEIPAGSIFMVRRTDTDWTHTGIVLNAEELFFQTIEGNTNDDGEREGYEVCSRYRGYTKKDFILLSK